MWIKDRYNWLFSLYQLESDTRDPGLKLLNSMRVTSRCRFNTAEGLKNLSNFSFLTTTILSLGLIFIPLYQIVGKQLSYSNNALTIIQIFLAVSILVYSVVIATAKYEIRSVALNDCGIKIKELIRKLRNELHNAKGDSTRLELEVYHKKYNKLTSMCENHKRVDFLFAMLQAPVDYKITGIKRAWYYLKGYFIKSLPYIIPSILMLCEVMFISDLLGVTRVFTPFFS